MRALAGAQLARTSCDDDGSLGTTGIQRADHVHGPTSLTPLINSTSSAKAFSIPSKAWKPSAYVCRPTVQTRATWWTKAPLFVAGETNTACIRLPLTVSQRSGRTRSAFTQPGPFTTCAALTFAGAPVMTRCWSALALFPTAHLRQGPVPGQMIVFAHPGVAPSLSRSNPVELGWDTEPGSRLLAPSSGTGRGTMEETGRTSWSRHPHPSS